MLDGIGRFGRPQHTPKLPSTQKKLLMAPEPRVSGADATHSAQQGSEPKGLPHDASDGSDLTTQPGIAPALQIASVRPSASVEPVATRQDLVTQPEAPQPAAEKGGRPAGDTIANSPGSEKLHDRSQSETGMQGPSFDASCKTGK